jgi:hypothetical protein
MSKASYRRPSPPWTQFALGLIGGWSDVFTLLSIREVPPAPTLPHAHPTISVQHQKLVAHEDPGCGGRTESSTETQRVEG